MDRLADNPDEGLTKGQRGRARMVAHNDLEVLVGMHETLDRGMLTERSRRTS